MCDWKEKPLSDLAILYNDSWKVGDEECPYIALEHIEEGKLRLNGIGYSDSVASNKYRFNEKNFLFGKLRPYFRKVVRPQFSGICSTDIWVVGARGETDSIFLFYLFANQEFVDLAYSGSSGTRMPRADWKFMKDTVWLIPSDIEEQRAIASVLSSLDDKIDMLHRQNQTLEAMAETRFRQWLVEEAEEGWGEIPLQEFLDFKEGPGIRNWQYTDYGVPFINIRLISNGEINVSKANFVSKEEGNGKYNQFHLQRKDMVVSTSGTLGKAAIIRDYHLPLLLNTSVIRFRPKDGINYSFMYMYLKSREFYEHLITSASGSVQLNFGPTHLKQIVMAIPPSERLENFREIVDPIYAKIEFNYNQIRTLEKLRDTLLPKLMSGEVRVKLEQQEADI